MFVENLLIRVIVQRNPRVRLPTARSVQEYILWVVFIFTTFIIHCAHAQVVQTIEPDSDKGPSQAASSQQVRRFEIQSERSILRIYVGRAGLLSGMGHNHVIVSRNISGNIHLMPLAPSSTAQILFPIQQLIVDDAAERLRAGDAYASIPAAADKSATRANMLGTNVLDAEKYPHITADIQGISASGTEWLFTVMLRFKDEEIMLELPAQISYESEMLVVDSSFKLDHQELGLRPYSVMGGMLRVAREIDFELHIESIPR